MAHEFDPRNVERQHRSEGWLAEGGDPSPRLGVRRRVLLVEDNRNLRVTTTRMLEHLGYAVAAVANGTEAVEAYRGGNPPDVVMLDVVLPGMSGLEALREIRVLAPDARVVLCSGAADKLERTNGVQGADAVLAKPYDVDLLAETLERVLRRGGR
jgi:CheY-like chemotaxis protein